MASSINQEDISQIQVSQQSKHIVSMRLGITADLLILVSPAPTATPGTQ